MDEIYEVISAFNRFETAAGARLRVDKTKGIHLNHPNGNHLCAELSIRWNEIDTKILGVIFTPDNKRSAKLNWDRIISSAEKRMETLSSRKLSMRGKANVVNTMVLSKAWHVGRVFLLNYP